ncbi:MAG: hypothetical protein JNN26_22515 [Candidatus Obscuribacter sp.]|nr:hypothetical protein [Candidatus Obscuribacter sp.]
MSKHWRDKLDLSIQKGFARFFFNPSPMIDNHFRRVENEKIVFVVQVSQGPIFSLNEDCVGVSLFLGLKYLPIENLYRELLLGYKADSLDVKTFWTTGAPMASLSSVEFRFCKQMTKEQWQAELDHLFNSFEEVALPYFKENANEEFLLKVADRQMIGRDGRDLYYKRPVQLFVAGKRAEALKLAEKTLSEIEAGQIEMVAKRYKSFLENLTKAESIMS